MRRRMLGMSTAVLLAGCAHAPVAAVRPAGAPAAAAIDRFSAAIAESDRATFATRDADGDGRLTAAELGGLPAAGFAALDADHDGRLSPAEAWSQTPDTAARARYANQVAHAWRLEANVPEGTEQAIAAKPLAASEVARFTERLAAAEAQPDGLASGGRPVVLVPGYLDASWYLNVVRDRVHAQRRSAHVLPLFPNVCDITVTAQRLRAFVDQVKASTGSDKVDLVAHSEGGLISRYYLQNLGGAASVGRMVSLAVPHHGTWLGYLGPGTGADQMQPGSAFLTALNKDGEAQGDVAYTSIRGGLDEIILPHASMIQAGADNRFVPWVEHATILTSRAVWRHVADGLKP